MATVAIAAPPPTAPAPSADEELLKRFREYVISVPGAPNLSEKAFQRAFAAETSTQLGRELLVAKMGLAAARRESQPVKIWAAEQIMFSGKYRTDTMGFTLKGLHNSSVLKTVDAYFPGTFDVHPWTDISGTLSVDDELYKDLDGPLFATLTAPKSECSKYATLIIKWFKGDQHDVHVATFTKDDFEFEIPVKYYDPRSVWSSYTPA